MSDTNETRRPGRPPYEPTDKDRAFVKALSGYGVPQHDICKVLRIHDDTLRKHFAYELETAETEASAQVAQSLFQNATKHMNVTAQIFWLKTRARWRETPPAEDAEAPRVIVTGGLPTT